MKTKKEIQVRIKKLESLLKQENEFIKNQPSIAFQRGEVIDNRDIYASQLLALKWVCE